MSDHQIELICDTCGNDQFKHEETDHDASKVFTCNQCEREYTKAELMELNSEAIGTKLTDIKDELVSDIQKKFKKLFK